MYEAHAAIVGTVITNPVKRLLPNGDEVLSFRMASNARRHDRSSGEWVDSGTLYLTVTCWRRLVRGVGASIMRGDPIIAYGQLRTNEYTNREGVERADLEMNASALGPDLARCIAKLDRPKVNAAGPLESVPSGDGEQFEPAEGDAAELDQPIAV